MAKQFGYTASILKDTNKLIASSQADWSSLKNGSYIIFDDDNDFYKVIDKKKFFYIKDFSVLKPDIISISGNTDIRLSLNDNITLTFKEYEMSSIKIKNGGKGFSEGDVIDINAGIYKTNPHDGLPAFGKVSIDEVGSEGQVIKASIISSGIYYETQNDAFTINNSLSFDVSYKLIDERTTEERAISQIKFDGQNTLIALNSNLPPNIKFGKLSTNKWELVLNINYAGANKINSSYRVLVDFTPHLGVPLMRGDLRKNVSVFNEAVTKIDGEIKKIWDKLGE